VAYEVDVNGRVLQVNVHRADGHFVVTVDGREWAIDAARVDAHTLSLLVGSSSQEVTIAAGATGQLAVGLKGASLSVTVGRRRWARQAHGGAGGGPQQLVAPMPGKIVRVLTKVGAAVQPRQPLVVVEAMKMENELRAASHGVVSRLLVQEGQLVDAGTLLLVVAPE
jgi:glutaconyl-CoA/methylmalonyl-CoA decarboxylase subunit gamma